MIEVVNQITDRFNVANIYIKRNWHGDDHRYVDDIFSVKTNLISMQIRIHQ